MPKLLLIDDDPALTELLSVYLDELGHKVHRAQNGDEGLRAFFALQPDLVILDVTMPQRDGWQTLERIRELASTPVIMLTARNEEASVLRGFATGADDYVTKPFSFAELAARIRSVLGRVPGHADKDVAPPTLQHGDLVVDITTRRVWRQRELLHLTPTEFKLLVALMQQADEVLTPQDLVRIVWGEQYLDDVGYVRRYIWHLRKKIELNPARPCYIHNEHGFGYRFFAADPQPGEEVEDSEAY
ncbi:response regulator transcription factor [Chloroflexales bacterium ZM16-3]|nr:response regulator transcription factor [Chloroflexales bacterium ZM16-3]